MSRRFTPVAEWEDARHLLGLHGERIAIAFLTSCGWSLEAHRFRLGRHDVDLIVRRRDVVAFVEVKTRRSVSCGTPLEAVSRRKQQDIARVASVWVLRHGRTGDQYRFDLIAGCRTLPEAGPRWRTYQTLGVQLVVGATEVTDYRSHFQYCFGSLSVLGWGSTS